MIHVVAPVTESYKQSMYLPTWGLPDTSGGHSDSPEILLPQLRMLEIPLTRDTSSISQLERES